jgi:hypothetical protein
MLHCSPFLCKKFIQRAVWLMLCSAMAVAEIPEPVTELASHPQWLALLHMQRNSITGQYVSEVDNPDFFLSRRYDDAEAEMLATLKALRQNNNDESSAWCRFPARAKFLATQIGLDRPADLQCLELDYWRGRFPADEVVLIYPDPYLKHVASVFGHTFLRLDAADKKKHPVLLSPSISYYADVGTTDNTALYITKGLTGRFPGIVEVAPYFQKLRKYSDGEDRDIREYKLNLSPEQTRFFIDHVWEVRGDSFHYFFLDENCSYRLIAMLDAVMPPFNTREQFASHTMPIDTVKALDKIGMIASSDYVPSAKKRFYEKLEQLNKHQREQLEALVKNNIAYDDVSDLTVLSLSENYSGIQMQADPDKHILHTLEVNKLIRRQHDSNFTPSARRSDLDAPDPMTNGHDMSRIQTGWLQDDGQDYLLLDTRLAYHDFHDPLPAYQRGVQMTALEASLRIRHGYEAVELDSIRWFGVQSYNVRDTFFQEPSWGFNISRQRVLIDENIRLLNTADGYRGVAYQCGALLCHGELTGGIMTGSSLDLGWTMRTGARAGLLYQQDAWSWSTSVAQDFYLVGDPNRLHTVQAEGGYRLERNLSLYGSYLREENRERNRERFTVSLRWSF